MVSKVAKFCWERVQHGEPEDCWPWTGFLNAWGYGHCSLNGKTVNASRAAYIVTHGPLADGLVVCHRCDNPICCNPNHLFAATQAENLADCRRKGRTVYRRGANHPRAAARLTEDMVREARRLFAKGVSKSEIARRWGFDNSTISSAVRGATWSHVE
jgi:hypothetical protein